MIQPARGDVGNPDAVGRAVGEDLSVHVHDAAALMKRVGKLAHHIRRIEKVGEAGRVKLRQLRILART
jgi:hypothetical protein